MLASPHDGFTLEKCHDSVPQQQQQQHVSMYASDERSAASALGSYGGGVRNKRRQHAKENNAAALKAIIPNKEWTDEAGTWVQTVSMIPWYLRCYDSHNFRGFGRVDGYPGCGEKASNRLLELVCTNSYAGMYEESCAMDSCRELGVCMCPSGISHCDRLPDRCCETALRRSTHASASTHRSGRNIYID